MRLGINGWRLCGQRTGVRRYLLNVIRHWTSDVASRFSRITLYTPRPIDPGDIPPNIHNEVLASDWPMLPWENLRLAPASRDDVLFCPSYTRPLATRGRTVVATHDAIYHVRPEMYPLSVRLAYRRLYDWSDRHATLIITDAEAVKREIVRFCRVPADKVRVTYLAPAECFTPLTDRAGLGAVRERYLEADRPFFLFVGKMSGRRSLPHLLEAFAQFKRRASLPHRLLLVGLNARDLDLQAITARLGIGDDVKYCGYVEDDDLNCLYNAAESFVMPAVYETSSLPIMEAQAVGLPVICIDSEGMSEITGGAALQIATLDVSLLSDAMVRMAGDAALRATLSNEGLRSAARFSWRRCSAETLAVLEEAAAL
jgi:glycosyltransferase involved in cell wall biosynthesis